MDVLPNGNTRPSRKSEDMVRNLDTHDEWSGYCVNWRYVTKDRQFIRISALAKDRTTWPSYYERGGTCP